MNRIISLVGVVASVVGLIAVAVKNIADSRNGASDNITGDNISTDDVQKYGVKIVDGHTGNDIEIFDEVFDTKEEAEDYALECGGCFSEGAEVLDYANRDFAERSAVDFEVFPY